MKSIHVQKINSEIALLNSIFRLNDKTVADVGCGTRVPAIELAKLFGDR